MLIYSYSIATWRIYSFSVYICSWKDFQRITSSRSTAAAAAAEAAAQRYTITIIYRSVRTISVLRHLGSDINLLSDGSSSGSGGIDSSYSSLSLPDPYRARPIQLCNEDGRLATQSPGL